MDTENETVRWIHLSDLHFKVNSNKDNSVYKMYQSLWNDIAEHRKNGNFDFIIFTGDISFKGDEEEYKQAEEYFFKPLLKAAGVSPTKIYIVPGNHDSNREAVRKFVNPLPNIRSTSDFDKNIQNDSTANYLSMVPFNSFSKFNEKYGKKINTALGAPQLIDTIEIGKVRLHLIGVNTALFSGYNKNAEGSVFDQGSLVIGDINIDLGKNVKEKPSLIIAIMHHPFEWLNDFSRKSVEGQFINQFDFILHGHLHSPNISFRTQLEGKSVIIPAGALYESAESFKSYNIVNIDIKKSLGTIHFRTYNQNLKKWQKDITSTGEEKDGKYDFKILSFDDDAIINPSVTTLRSIRDYKIEFSTKCRNDLLILNLSENDAVDMLQNEFRSHLNYFLNDLSDYPFPVKHSYIFLIDKIGNGIEFKSIMKCDYDYAKLTSWEDILQQYRILTRLAYRHDPDKIMYVNNLLQSVIDRHIDLTTRINKHFEIYEGVTIKPISDETEKINKKDNNDFWDNARYHIVQSMKSCVHANETYELFEKGEMLMHDARGLVISDIEKSLQHLHRIILKYFPVDNN